MAKRDYYEVLGVTKNSNETEVKKAYRNLARTYHPDVSKEENAETKFKEISEAYEVLSDPNKKARYDQFGHEGVNNQFGGGSYGGFGGFDGMGFDLGDIFDSFFGSSSSRRSSNARPSGPERGSDLRIDINISFKEAIFGVEKDIEIRHLEKCSECNGSGAEKESKIVNCDTCGGKGQVHQTQKTIFGSFSQIAMCPKCNGAGKWPEKACKECSGKGKIQKSKSIKIKIPAGVDSGARLRVSGEGNVGEKGGPSGDLYVMIYAQPDETKTFKRQDNDVYIELAFDYHQLTLGDDVEIPTLEGTTKLNIPEATQVGTIFTLKGKGVPVLGTDGRRRGDLYVLVNVIIPKKLSSEEEKLIKELSNLYKKDESKHDESKHKDESKNKNESKHGESFINILKNAINKDK